MNTGVWRDGQSVVQYSQPGCQGINFIPPGKSKKWRHAAILTSMLTSVLSDPGLDPLVKEIVLCSWTRHFTLRVLPSAQVYKWVGEIVMLG